MYCLWIQVPKVFFVFCFFFIRMFYCEQILNVRNKDYLFNQKNLYLMFYFTCHKLLIIYTHTTKAAVIFLLLKNIRKLDFFSCIHRVLILTICQLVQLINQTLDNRFNATATLAGNHKTHHQIIVKSFFFQQIGSTFP